MANQEITARLRVKVEGLKESVLHGKALNQELDKSERLLSARGSGGASKTRAAAMAASASPAENVQYGQMRGTAGATGAAARDFAEQSRGLGGLVRLYATFAANIFAVSAAFNVLRNAADTTNLIAGLNTLGAVSGKSLGTVAKQLAEASDGAISLREAMSSVAMTSSAGMTNQNILRLGAVAKTASLALGVSMPDALNRLSRGIVKLEPELLDELGIFTKIEPATQAYALQLGKAASQLTDFERRQAFANAVLKEGEDKFAALADQKANPYDKLLASLKNVAFSGLELLNTVLKPIVEILASSPTALALGLGAVIAAIVRKAIPAVADLRTAFGEKLEDGIKRTQSKIEDLKKSYAALADYSIKQAGYAEDAKMAKLEESEKRILEFYKRTAAPDPRRGALLSGQTPEFGRIIQENPLQLTQDNLQQLKAAHADYVSKVSAGNIKLTEEVKQRIAFEKEFIADLGQVLAGEKDFATVREKALAQAKTDLENSKLAKEFTLDEQKLRAKGRKDEIVAAAVARSNTLGIGIAWKLLKIDIENASTSVEKFNAKLALAQGILGIAGGKLLNVLSGVGSALTAISIGSAVFAIFESIFSKNEKQMQSFKASIDAANDSVDNTKRTLAELDRAGLGKSLTDTAISLSNAFSEISSSAQKLVADARLAKEASTGWFDTIVEGFKDFFGYGIDDQVAKGLSKQLMSALNILRRSDIDEKYREQFKELLQVKDLSASTVEKALSTLGDDVRNRFTALLESARKELDKTRSDLESFKDASDKAVKSYQEFLQSTANTNPLFKLGEGMEVLADSMINAMQRGTVGIQAAFEELSKDPKKVALFGKDFIQQFVAIEQGFKDQSNAVREYTRLQQELEQELEKVQIEEAQVLKARETARKQGKVGLIDKFFGTGAFQGQEALDKSAKLNQQIKAIQEATLKIPTDQIEKGKELFARGLDIAFQRGAEYIKTALGQAQEKAAMAIAKANSMVLTGERAVEESTRLKIKELDIQIKAVDVNIALIRENELLQAELSALRAAVEYSRISADKNATAEEKRASYETKIVTDLVAKALGGKINAKDAASEATKYTTPDASGLVTVPTGASAEMILKQVRAIMMGFDRKIAEQQAKKIELGGERAAAGIQGQIEGERARLADINKRRAIENETNQLLIARQGILQSIAGITSQEIIDADARIEREAILKRQKTEISTIELARDQAAKKSAEALGQDDRAKFEREAQEQRALIELTEEKQKQEISNFDLRTKQKKLDLTIQDIQKRAEVDKAGRDAVNAVEEANLEIRRAQFTSAAELYNIDKQLVITKTAQFDAERISLDFIKQQGDLKAAKDEKELQAKERLKALGLDQEQFAVRFAEEQQRLQAIYDYQLQALQVQKNQRLETLEIQKQQTLEQAKQAQKLDEAARLADALAGVFGNTGKKVGDISTALIEFDIKQVQNQKALKKLQAERATALLNDFTTKEEMADIDDAIGRTTKKNRDDELAGQAKILSSSKALFSNKTAAYKVLDKMEKATHLLRMTNTAVEFATKIKTFALELAAAGQKAVAEVGLENASLIAKIPAYTAGIFGKITSQIGLPGPVVAAGIVAAIFAAFGGGKGNKVNTAGLTADDMNKVAGTGQMYNEKQELVVRQGGVLGDPTAVADSVKSSIEILSENFFNILNSDSSKVVKSLKGVELNTQETVKALLGKISGFAGGQSPFGTREGTSSSFNIWWGGGKKVSTEILSTGIEITGKLGDLINNTGETIIRSFENVLVKTKKSFLGITYNTSESLNQKFGELDSRVKRAVIGTLQNFEDTLLGTATILDGNTDRISGIIKDFDFNLKTNLKGLSGEEAVNKILGEISVNLNQVTLQAYPWIEAFTNINEEFYEAAARLTRDSEQIRYGLSMIGKGINELDAETRTGIEQDLIEQAGGINKFADGLNYFFENFLSDSEQFAFNQERLTKAFRLVNCERPNSKAAYLDLVNSIDEESSDLSRKQLATLLTLAEDYDKLYGTVNKQVKDLLQDLKEKTLDLTMNLSPLDKALYDIDKQTNKYVEELVAAKEATYENIKVIGEWSKASKLKELENNLRTAYENRKQELETTINTLKTLKDRLAELTRSIFMGANSLLSPQEKYQRLLTEYNTTLAQAAAGDQKSVEKFPQITESLLTAGKELYGSSELYAQLFEKVTGDINTVDLNNEQQLSTAEKQLKEAELQVGALIVINSTLTRQEYLLQAIARYSLESSKNPLLSTASGDVLDYFTRNADVLAAYGRNDYGLTPEQFVREHYRLYGAAEQRMISDRLKPTVSVNNTTTNGTTTSTTTSTTTGTTTDSTPSATDEVAIANTQTLKDELILVREAIETKGWNDMVYNRTYVIR